jgi:hypothetical protein
MSKNVKFIIGIKKPHYGTKRSKYGEIGAILWHIYTSWLQAF